jgi:hypothetical protein
MAQVNLTVNTSGAPSLTLQVPGIQGPAGAARIITDATTERTLTAGDNGAIILFTSSSAIALNVPVGLPLLFEAMFVQEGTGQITVTPVATTVNSIGGARKSFARYGSMSLLCRSTDNFLLFGDIVP